MANHRFGNNFRSNPKMIILDSRDYTKYIAEKLIFLGLDYITDNITILETIFVNLQDDYQVEHNLEVSLWEIISEVHGFLHGTNGDMDYDGNCRMVVDSIVKAGLAMYVDLQNMGAYVDGKLDYNFAGKNGMDIVLLRNDVEPEEWKRINFRLLKG